MKILVSSKNFYSVFKSLKDKPVSVVWITKDGYFSAGCGDDICSIPVETKDINTTELQHNCRWDWLLRDIGAMQERPIVIEFTNNKARIVLEY